MNKKHQENTHTPVLLVEVLKYLAPKAGESLLDVTAGYGGHARAILERTLNTKDSVLVDRDEEAIASLHRQFGGHGVGIIRQDFLGVSQNLRAAGQKFDLLLADLGVSSPQLDTAERGFAVNRFGALDMRMDQSQQRTASELLNCLDEATLAEILRSYGEEPKARQIARRIVAARPIESTEQLAALVSRVWPRGSRIHPATRTFQALRIAVNDELAQLERSLPVWLELLNPGGRMAIVSFHSLEDRIVKRFLADSSGTYDSELEVLTAKPVTASATEIVTNPRARSAKLRAAAKIKTQKKGQDASECQLR